MRLHLIKSGKVKDVYQISSKELLFVFSDRISVFDKIIPSMIPHKGETLARTSAYWFELVQKMGINTHYLELVAPNVLRVSRVQVINNYNLLTPSSKSYLIPLECITRYFVYGSLWDRVQQGKIKAEKLGFSKRHKVKLAEPLPLPFFEVTTKLEKIDRKLTTAEAIKISGITKNEFEEIKEIAFRIDSKIASKVKQQGLIHVDGKKEFAFNEERNLMVVDTFGTADEDRFWDAKEFEKQNYVEKSKEFVRQYYRRIGYHSKLMKSRLENKPEPPIPALPPHIVSQVSEIYIKLYECITGQKF